MSERPTIGLMRQSSAPEPSIASTMKLVGAPRNRSTRVGRGRSIDGAKTSRRRFLDHGRPNVKNPPVRAGPVAADRAAPYASGD